MIGVVLAHIFDAEVVNDERKIMFLVAFFQREVVRATGAYPNLERCSWRRSFTMRPCCFRTGIPLRISIYT